MRTVTALGAVLVLALSVPIAIHSAPPSKSGPMVLSAVVDVDGHLVYGIGALSSEAIGTDGYYVVAFNRDVSHCTYVGSSGDYLGDGYAGPDDAITIGVGPWAPDVNKVEVVQYDTILQVDSYSSGFHLVVVC